MTLLRRAGKSAQLPRVLILTPVKDARDCIAGYCQRIRSLTYPHHLLSLGFLESDSSDGTYDELAGRLGPLRKEFAGVTLCKKDFQFHIPVGVARYAPEIQQDRRSVLARSRNHLLFRALRDEDWVLWLDVDVIEYPADIIQRLLATGKTIVQPHCVHDYGGPTFDRNAWSDGGRLLLDNLRNRGEFVPLDAVGGTMLLVHADAHRDGLIFPSFRYGQSNAKIRNGIGELETEGLGIMASDMGHQCWGMPHLEILHGRW
jgi:peptide chain release factor subunit 1